jgi:hypothetical protein
VVPVALFPAQPGSRAALAAAAAAGLHPAASRETAATVALRRSGECFGLHILKPLKIQRGLLLFLQHHPVQAADRSRLAFPERMAHSAAAVAVAGAKATQRQAATAAAAADLPQLSPQRAALAPVAGAATAATQAPAAGR